MKQRIIYLLFCSLFVFTGCEKDTEFENEKSNVPNESLEEKKETAEDVNVNFAVVSDIHYFSPQLFDDTENEEFNNYLSSDRKMIKESSAILKAALKKVEENQPKFLIIPGDLTKDGELQSHNDLSKLLDEVEAKGTQVFVVPGNHDINNPHAKSFIAGQETDVESITKDQFAEIYHNFGYDEALEKDQHSLSYVAEPSEGVWLLGLDVCKYDENDENTCVTNGALREETKEWVKSVLAKAKEQNKQVFAMMHHGLVEHIFGESLLLSEYLVDNNKEVSTELTEAGLKFMFTGHMHANDIAKFNAGSGFIYDIETGSTVTYPCPMRFITYNPDESTLKIQTKHVESIEYTPAISDFQSYAHSALTDGILQLGSSLIMSEEFKAKVMSEDTELPDMVTDLLSDKEQLEALIRTIKADLVVGDLLASHYAGDEEFTSEKQDNVAFLAKQISPILKLAGVSLPMEISSLFQLVYNDYDPADNNIIIDCKTGTWSSFTE